MRGPSVIVRVLIGLALSWAAALPAQTLHVEGTAFVLVDADGHDRRSPELVGAVLELPGGTALRIDAVSDEISDSGERLWLHRMSLRDAGGAWSEACEPDADRRRLGFPLAGHYAADSGLVVDSMRFSLTCTSGAQGKCVRFGYAPWAHARDGTPLLAHFNACVRMVRADYCGDGTAHTRDGTLIDVYDRVGIQTRAAPDLVFEAGWSAAGAVCVHHSRIAAAIDLGALRRSCPRLATVGDGRECDESSAAAKGALLFNGSRFPGAVATGPAAHP